MKPTFELEHISDETLHKLAGFGRLVSDLECQIRTLTLQANTLTHKYSFSECRTAGCRHTAGRSLHCACEQTCCRSRSCDTGFKDCFEPMPKKARPELPILGWKYVTNGTQQGKHYAHATYVGDYRVFPVTKETNSYLYLDDGTPLGLRLEKHRMVTYDDDCVFVDDFCCADYGVASIEAQLGMRQECRQEEHDRIMKIL